MARSNKNLSKRAKNNYAYQQGKSYYMGDKSSDFREEADKHAEVRETLSPFRKMSDSYYQAYDDTYTLENAANDKARVASDLEANAEQAQYKLNYSQNAVPMALSNFYRDVDKQMSAVPQHAWRRVYKGQYGDRASQIEDQVWDWEAAGDDAASEDRDQFDAEIEAGIENDVTDTSNQNFIIGQRAINRSYGSEKFKSTNVDDVSDQELDEGFEALNKKK